MHPSLYKLTMLTARSNFRRLFRSARTVRGAFLLIFMIALFAMMLLPSIFIATMRNRPNVFPAVGRALSPAGSTGDQPDVRFHFGRRKSPVFQPAGSRFPVSGPVSPAELLIFKLAKTLVGLELMSLIFSASFLLYLGSWLPAFVGIFLTLGFVQLLAMATAFLGQIVAEHLYRSASDRSARGRTSGRCGPCADALARPFKVRPSLRGTLAILDRNGAAGSIGFSTTP